MDRQSDAERREHIAEQYRILKTTPGQLLGGGASGRAEARAVYQEPDDPQITDEQGRTLIEMDRENQERQAEMRAAQALAAAEKNSGSPTYEHPWPMPARSECFFYHTMAYPNGDSVQGGWTMPDFQGYIGGYDVSGKTVLDVGAASGYLSFAAEKEGAIVTALDAATTKEFRHFPFASADSYKDIAASREHWTKHNLIPIKKSWWYSWHKNNSNARCIYAPHVDMYEWDISFDVVMAGAIVEHLSDPVFSIGAWTRIAKEAVLIPFTNVAPGDDLAMRPMTDLTNAQFNYAWWMLTRPLYERLFDNCGFDVEFSVGKAYHNDGPASSILAERPSLIARRRK